MHRSQMSEMEKLHIMEQLRLEELCTKKAQMYLAQTRDPAIQGILQQSLDKGQRHMNSLNSLLQEAGMTGMTSH